MIVDIDKFIRTERPYWKALESILARREKDPSSKMTLQEVQHFHYLYRRASADLAKVSSFATEKEIRGYLETMVAASYSQIHEIRSHSRKIHPLKWLFGTFPRTFRKHIRSFGLSIGMTVLGILFGWGSLLFDPSSKAVLMPFGHLQGDPVERVREEESSKGKLLTGKKTTFSADLMTHNTRVSIFTFAMGITWGLGTVILLFYNGAILGAVCADYILAGQTPFLVGWLLPHGIIEIPAILIAGQSGFVLASAMIGRGNPMDLPSRLRSASKDLATLIGGTAILLIWAGIIEAFFSQYHEPILPYFVKIVFGVIEGTLLVLFLGWSGGHSKEASESPTSSTSRA